MSNASSSVPGSLSWSRPLAAIGLTVVIFTVGQVLGSLVIWGLVGLTKALGASQPALFGSDVYLQFAFALAVYGIMTGLMVWAMRLMKLSFADIGFNKRPRLGDAGWAVVAFLVYISSYLMLVSFVAPLIPGLDLDQAQDVGFDGASGVLALLLVYGALAIVAPVAEELLMRGFLFTSLRRKVPFWLAAAVTSALFASLHLGGGEDGAGPLWIAAIDTFILSVVLCYLREKTGRLWAGIALHMIKNSIAFAALFILTPK